VETIVVVLAVLVQIVRVLLKDRLAATTEKAKTLCHDCTFAHLQVGANGRSAVFCTFGSVVRPVQAEVVFCTDFRNRYVPVRQVPVGFVPAISVTEPGGNCSPLNIKRRRRTRSVPKSPITDYQFPRGPQWFDSIY
jgi:hypothetical protein